MEIKLTPPPARYAPRWQHALRAGTPAHLRNHFTPGCRQDHPHREVASFRRRDPHRWQRKGAQGQPARDVRLMEIEKQRCISVASSVMQMEYRDCVLKLLDTPGHQDFSEDTDRVLTAMDAALMVIDAVNGVESQTLRLLEVCRARNTPIITFINKLDREVREPLELINEIERVLQMPVVPFTWPIGMGFNAYRIALDVVNAPAFLASYSAELEVAAERWPGLRFHALREHAGLVFQTRLSH